MNKITNSNEIFLLVAFSDSYVYSTVRAEFPILLTLKELDKDERRILSKSDKTDKIQIMEVGNNFFPNTVNGNKAFFKDNNKKLFLIKNFEYKFNKTIKFEFSNITLKWTRPHKSFIVFDSTPMTRPKLFLFDANYLENFEQFPHNAYFSMVMVSDNKKEVDLFAEINSL